MDLPPCIFLPRVVDIVVHVALERAIAAVRVRVEPTACSHGDLGCLLYRLHREIFGRLDDDIPLTTDPGDDRRPIFVIVAPTGLAFLAAPPRPAAQRLLPAVLGLALVSGGVIEVVGF